MGCLRCELKNSGNLALMGLKKSEMFGVEFSKYFSKCNQLIDSPGNVGIECEQKQVVDTNQTRYHIQV